MNKPDYSDKSALLKYHSSKYPDNFDFAMFLSERLEYFSDRFSEEHEEFFDMLWQEMKRRLKQSRKRS